MEPENDQLFWRFSIGLRVNYHNRVSKWEDRLRMMKASMAQEMQRLSVEDRLRFNVDHIQCRRSGRDSVDIEGISRSNPQKQHRLRKGRRLVRPLTLTLPLAFLLEMSLSIFWPV